MFSWCVVLLNTSMSTSNYAAYKDTIVAGNMITIINKNHTQSR